MPAGPLHGFAAQYEMITCN